MCVNLCNIDRAIAGILKVNKIRIEQILHDNDGYIACLIARLVSLCGIYRAWDSVLVEFDSGRIVPE